MGRKGVLSSAAAGGSLIAASIVLVIGVAGLIAFRGFDSANAAAEQQSVVIDRSSGARESGGTTKPAAAVIGSAKPNRAVRSSRSAKPGQSPLRRRVNRRAARSGQPAPAKLRTVAAPAAKAPEVAPAPKSAPEREATEVPVATGPADDLVEDVTGGVEGAARKPTEAVGDLLLDVRDLLP